MKTNHMATPNQMGDSKTFLEVDFSKEKGSVTDKIYNYSLDDIKVVLLNTQSIYKHMGITEFLKKVNTFESMGSIITTLKCGQKSLKTMARAILIKLRVYRLFN